MTDRRAGMRWSFPIGAPFGIGIHVHATFLILLAWIVLGELSTGHGFGAALDGLAVILAVFALVVVHELCHALAARRYGIKTRDITLLPIGGIANLERMPDKPSHELFVALAGPAVNVALAVVFAGLIFATGGTPGPIDTRWTGGLSLARLMWINVMLAVFNLLPAFPMDGGRVFRAFLALWMDYRRATVIAARLGQGIALLFAIIGIFGNPMLLFIALFVWLGAEAESSLVNLKAILRGIPIRTAMITEFKTLSPRETLARAVELILAGFQHEFPVVQDGKVVGVLTREDLVSGLAGGGRDMPVEQAMRREFETADPSETLDTALGRLHGKKSAIVVQRGDRILGLLTPENIGELLLMERALREGRA